MTTDENQPPMDMRARDVQPALRMFHRVLGADLLAVRQALIDMRARFDGHVADDALGRIELVLAEVLNNIVEHGARRVTDRAGTASGVSIHLTVTRHDGGLACAVTDNGRPLPLDCLITPDKLATPEAAAMRDGGFGWYMIRDLTQSLFYYREGGRNVLCFNVPRYGPERRARGRRDVA